MTTTLAIPLLAVRTLHATPFEVGLLTTFEFLAFLVIGLPAGAGVDRMRRRNVMGVADAGRSARLGPPSRGSWCAEPGAGVRGGIRRRLPARLLRRLLPELPAFPRRP